MNKSRSLSAAVIAATGILYLPTLGIFLVADSWVFMMPESFFDTFRYFLTTMLPADTNALWLRPIPMFTFWLDRLLWQGTSWGPHLQNVAFHIVNCVLIWKITEFSTRRSSAGDKSQQHYFGPVAACLVYGLHPLTVGAVAWVAARFDVMCVTFGLSAVYLWLKDDSAHRSAAMSLMKMLLLFLSLLSKEQGVVFIAACMGISAVRFFKRKDGRKFNLKDIAILCILSATYLAYRLLVFKGLGGYMEARHGLSPLPPVYYLVAILFPYMNVIAGATPSLTLGIASVIIIIVMIALYKTGNHRDKLSFDPELIAGAAVIIVIGLATNAPNPGMTFSRIMGHAESRFALIPIAGAALTAGYVAEYLASSKRWKNAILTVLALWSLSGAWRTDAQIQAWENAGETAKTIVDDAKMLAPDPAPSSRVLFFDIPRTNDQWAYIYGIGLREALILRYQRWDVDFNRYPTREDLRTARPDRDFVLAFNPVTRHLERLTARRNDTKTQ